MDVNLSPGDSGLCLLISFRSPISRLFHMSEVNLKMYARTFTAVIHKELDLYVAECPETGTVSQGYTIEDALENLREATELYLEEFPDANPNRFFMTTFEISHA